MKTLDDLLDNFLDDLVYSPYKVLRTFFILIVLIVMQLCLIIALFRVVYMQHQQIETITNAPKEHCEHHTINIRDWNDNTKYELR